LVFNLKLEAQKETRAHTGESHSTPSVRSAKQVFQYVGGISAACAYGISKATTESTMCVWCGCGFYVRVLNKQLAGDSLCDLGSEREKIKNMAAMCMAMAMAMAMCDVRVYAW
jgi:hypothetical protein